MEGNFKEMQKENFALRQYVINLQSRLLDIRGDIPQPPPGLVLAPTHHGHGGPQPAAPTNADQPPAQVAAPAAGAGTSLEVVAQAVAGLTRNEPQSAIPSHLNRGVKADPNANDDDSKADEEIGRQLQADGSLPSAPM